MADLAIPDMTKYRYFFVHTKRLDPTLNFPGPKGIGLTCTCSIRIYVLVITGYSLGVR